MSPSFTRDGVLTLIRLGCCPPAMAGLVFHVFICLGHAYILYAVSSARIPNWWGVRRQDVSIITMSWMLT